MFNVRFDPILLLLGDDAFVERYQSAHAAEQLREVSKAQRRSVALPLAQYKTRSKGRDEAMARAYLSGAYTMDMIARHFKVHCMTVSRAVRKLERREG
jgi:putative transposase